MPPFLSVVVPVYNVELYIEQLIDSFAGFDRLSVEFVFVEDCSTDGTAALLSRAFADLGPTARIIRHAKNGGLSAARNTGLAEARGEYVWFIDSDDVVNAAEIATWYDVLRREQPDVILFDYLDFGEADIVELSGQPQFSKGLVYWSPRPRSTVPGAMAEPNRLMEQALRDLRLHAWSYCFRRALLPADPFPAGRVYEDIATIPGLLHEVKTAYYHPRSMILYRNRLDSISKKPVARRDLDLAHAMERDWHRLKSRFRTESERTAYLGAWLKTLLWAINNLHKNGHIRDREVFAEYASAWRSYRRAAGWRHLNAIRNLPPRRTPRTIAASAAMTLSPRLLIRMLDVAMPSAS